MKINVPNINVPIYLCFVIFERRGIHIVAFNIRFVDREFCFGEGHGSTKKDIISFAS